MLGIRICPVSGAPGPPWPYHGTIGLAVHHQAPGRPGLVRPYGNRGRPCVKGAPRTSARATGGGVRWGNESASLPPLISGSVHTGAPCVSRRRPPAAGALTRQPRTRRPACEVFSLSACLPRPAAHEHSRMSTRQSSGRDKRIGWRHYSVPGQGGRTPRRASMPPLVGVGVFGTRCARSASSCRLRATIAPARRNRPFLSNNPPRNSH